MKAAACCAIALALAVTACRSLESTDSGVPLRELLAGNLCTAAGAELRALEDDGEAYRLTGAHRIGAQPASLDIDRDHERMLLVAAGRKPSAGYRLQLTETRAALRDGVLHLPVTLSTPGEGFQATMITSPCVLLAVQKGPYRRIVAEDLGLEMEMPGE